VRRLLRFALTILRVDLQFGADLEIALTEACSLIHFEKSFA
jgi:serine/threonine-protein kinase RsbW